MSDVIDVHEEEQRDTARMPARQAQATVSRSGPPPEPQLLAPGPIAAGPRTSVAHAVEAVDIDGVTTHLLGPESALAVIAGAARGDRSRPLAVGSINLDHIHHFGQSRRAARGLPPIPANGGIDWLELIDGAPIARQAERVTGRPCPKLSGSDLIVPILDQATREHQSFGVVGGPPEDTPGLCGRIASQWPELDFAGHWTPPRAVLESADASTQLAVDISAAHVDILLVCLGKPRQETWIDRFGLETGARVLLAFGGVVDLLAGRASRAPSWVSGAGFEWAWRLAHEPRRLARRYLVEGPPAYVAVRRRTRAAGGDVDD